ncbi:MAG: hypothetical protein Kow0068_25670 [Marinilabiliales bacterium]
MQCVYQCPGLAIFGYNLKNNKVFLPVEFDYEENTEVFLVDNNGNKVGEGKIEKILKKPNKTHIARVIVSDLKGEELKKIRGFILKDRFPEKLELKPADIKVETQTYVCHCDDVQMDEILEVIGDRKFISTDEIKHTTRLGMGACRGKRCIKRLKQSIGTSGIAIVGDATPRGPLSNQLELGELYPSYKSEKIIPNGEKTEKVKVKVLIAGGGIAGSALFRYISEKGWNPVLINNGRGASWRNIAGGRPNFSLPELSDIAEHNLEIFKKLHSFKPIDFYPTKYVTFAHDEETYKALELSMQWSDAKMIDTKDFSTISPYFNKKLNKYSAALITNNCWQASPGKTVDILRRIGLKNNGTIHEDCELIDLHKTREKYYALVKTHDKKYIEYECEHFINALGPQADKFAKKIGIDTGLFAVKHQAFITRRLPALGYNDFPLPMLIDRRKYKGFSAVYGQQLAETGQIIGCASPLIEPNETDKNLKINSKDFMEIISEVFTDWIPMLSSVGYQAVWAGYYVEPKMIIDPSNGLFVGLRGQGFMLGQYLAKLYVDALTGSSVPDYFKRLSLSGDGLKETAFK